jgi:hypothetical protein
MAGMHPFQAVFILQIAGPLGRRLANRKTAGEGARLPNPHILVRPFAQREAVLSSKIEGTQATLGELLAAEAGSEDALGRATRINGLLAEWKRKVSRESSNNRCVWLNS